MGIILNKDFHERKAKAVQAYINSEGNLMELQEKYKVAKSSIHKGYQLEVKEGKEVYGEIMQDSRENIKNITKLLKKSLSKISEINSIEDISKLQDVALKSQKLVNLIEGADTKANDSIPSQINIQVINNNS